MIRPERLTANLDGAFVVFPIGMRINNLLKMHETYAVSPGGCENVYVNKPSPGTPYAYRIKAHLERSSGTGARLDARACNFTFTRQ
jgi:hypothetical protein